MEKIYEEHNGSQQRKKMNFSIVLSFVVAVFAIMSLIVVGFNQISYAAPTGSEDSSVPVPHVDSYIRAESSDGVLAVPIIYDENEGENAYLFCIQRQVTDFTDEDYSRINGDSGLIAILNQSSVLGGPGIMYPESELSGNGGKNRYVEIYATQIAIWQFLDSKGADKSELSNVDNLVINGMSKLEYTPNIDDSSTYQTIWEYDGEDSLVFKSKLNNAIKAAKEASTTGPNTLSAKIASNDISLVDDGKLYQTAEITAETNHPANLEKFYVTLTGIDGAYAVDKDGNEKTAFNSGEKFYVRVPVDKVTEEHSQVHLKISGTFNNYHEGAYYGATNSQNVVKLGENYRIDNDTTINFLVSPDTGMTTAQTIYFIGLIVLLCGVGIIYANAKPVEEK